MFPDGVEQTARSATKQQGSWHTASCIRFCYGTELEEENRREIEKENNTEKSMYGMNTAQTIINLLQNFHCRIWVLAVEFRQKAIGHIPTGH